MMDKPLSPETQSQIRALCESIAQRDQLGEDVQEELCGHIEDKVLAYLDGKEALTEEDALLLAREHFGKTENFDLARCSDRQKWIVASCGHKMTKPNGKRIAIGTLLVSMLVFSCITFGPFGGDPDFFDGVCFSIEMGRLEVFGDYDVGEPISFEEFWANSNNKYTSYWRPWKFEYLPAMNTGHGYGPSRGPEYIGPPDFVRPAKCWVVRVPAALIPLAFFFAGWGCLKIARACNQRRRAPKCAAVQFSTLPSSRALLQMHR